MAPEYDDEGMARLIDIIGDGDLTAEAQERYTEKAYGRSMRASGKFRTRPLSLTAELGSRARW
jgi:hypothetical protein